jgi:predicted secreted hydrolase
MTRRTAGGPGRRSPSLAVLVAGALLVSACTTPILANPPLSFPSPVPPSAAPSTAPDPIPIAFPRDDGPHDRLTEWWYYTGHLRTDTGRRFGFEAVVFRAERGTVPPAWAAHLALTDESGSRFSYAQRNEIGTQVDRSPRDGSGAPTGFDLQIGGLSPTLVTAGAPAAAAPWRLAGAGGTDRIEATLAPEETGAAGAAFGLHLDLEATKPAALHDGDGFVDFGAGGSSYYYSRTRLTATGTVQVDGEQLSADGIAWFDHQWGDFVSVGGGWNWFAVNLGDGTDLTISEVFGPHGETGFAYGTVVEPDGAVRHLDGGALSVTAANDWASPQTGRLYPTDWLITIPGFRDGRDLRITLEPTVDDQELDARATTGVIYWEGSQRVGATLGSIAPTTLDGEAYVEITRYGP